MLADDSGIELAALGGGPGVLTARWAQGGHVERALAAVEGRTAAPATCASSSRSSPDGREVRGTGVLEGDDRDRGGAAAEGFGFDPVFVPDGRDAHGRRARRRVEGASTPTALSPRVRSRPRLTAARARRATS